VPTASHTHVVQVHHKLDMLGIGAEHTKDPNGIAWKQNRDFENLLKRLNANSEDPTGDGVDSAPIDGFHLARVDEPVMDVTTVGSKTEGRDEERMVEKGRKNEKKKRPRCDDNTSETGRKPKKRKKDVGSTTGEPATEPVEEVGSPNPNSPAQGIITFVVATVPIQKQLLTLKFPALPASPTVVVAPTERGSSLPNASLQLHR